MNDDSNGPNEPDSGWLRQLWKTCGPGTEPAEHLALQQKYRASPPPAFDSQEATCAVIFALRHNGMVAWNGDGVSIVTQMIEAQARRVRDLEAALAATQISRDLNKAMEVARARRTALEEANESN